MFRFTRLLWLLVALLAPRGVAYAGPIYGDLDHDGRRDLVSLDPAHSSVLNVWLSSTNTSRVLRTSQPVVTVAVLDIDGDGRQELIAADSAVRLHVWRANKHGKVRPYSPRRPGSHVDPITGKNVESGEDDADDPQQGATRVTTAFDTLTSALGTNSNRSIDASTTSSRAATDPLPASDAPRGPPPSRFPF